MRRSAVAVAVVHTVGVAVAVAVGVAGRRRSSRCGGCCGRSRARRYVIVGDRAGPIGDPRSSRSTHCSDGL